MIFPTYRKYSSDIDFDAVVKLLADSGYDAPYDKSIFSIVALDDSGKIIGACFLLVNHFVDPLVVDKSLPLLTRAKLVNDILHMIGGIAMYLGIDRLYFVSEVEKHFPDVMKKHFKVKEFTSSTVYSIELR
jgi:hypothetical protein